MDMSVVCVPVVHVTSPSLSLSLPSYSSPPLVSTLHLWPHLCPLPFAQMFYGTPSVHGVS